MKDYIRRIRYYTQKDLARDAVIAPETLSKMVKGKRKSGTEFRRHLLSIIKVLCEKQALFSLAEANYLITRIPKEGPLDPRDQEEAQIIALFDPPAVEEKQAANQNEDEIAIPDILLSSEDQRDEIPALETVSEPEHRHQQDMPSPISTAEAESNRQDESPASTAAEPERNTRQDTPFLNTTAIGNYIRRNVRKPLWWIAAALLIVVALVVIFDRPQNNPPVLSKQTSACSTTNGVTLYTEINYRGHCHTFGPGDYELASYGLEENVSSIWDAKDGYYVVLYDRGKNFFKLDKSIPVLPAEWDNRADTLHIEKHRVTICHPGHDGIIAYINPNYTGGCLFITHDIPDLTTLNFDDVLVSIQFVGSYRHTRQLVIYKQPNYKDECGAYWQDQSDLLQCARNALSVRGLPFIPPTPIPTAIETQRLITVL